MMQRRQFVRGACVTLAALASGNRADAAASPWPGRNGGSVSLTYDDGLGSQLDIAVPALEALHLRATFFITLNARSARHGEWEALVRRGHELADHTVHHPCDLAHRNSRRFGELEIAPLERWLDQASPGRSVNSFAYPCDVTNLGEGTPNQQERRYDRLLGRLGIEVARTSEGEPNRRETVLRRPHRLQALAIGYDAPDLAAVEAYLDQATQRGQWAILIFHGIGEPNGDPGTVSEQLHRSILREVATRPLWCAPVGEVFAYIRQR